MIGTLNTIRITISYKGEKQPFPLSQWHFRSGWQASNIILNNN